MTWIGHLNMGIIFYCIWNSHWCIYNTQSKSDWFFNTLSRVLQANWLIFEDDEKTTLNTWSLIYKKCLYGTTTEYSNNELLLQVARLEEANLHIHSNSTNIHEGVECKYAVLLLDHSLLCNTHGHTVSLAESEVQGNRKLKQLGILKDIKTNNWLTFLFLICFVIKK